MLAIHQSLDLRQWLSLLSILFCVIFEYKVKKTWWVITLFHSALFISLVSNQALSNVILNMYKLKKYTFKIQGTCKLYFVFFKWKAVKLSIHLYLSQAKLRLKAAHGWGGALQLHVFLPIPKFGYSMQNFKSKWFW